MLFSSYRDDPLALMALPVSLANRLFLGIFLGAVFTEPGPDDNGARAAQTACLVVLSLGDLAYIAYARPDRTIPGYRSVLL